MGQQVARTEELDEEAVEIFELVVSGKKTAKQIADDRNISLKTAYNRINRGREIVEGTIKTIGQKYLADVWKKYDYLWEEAKREWETSRNVVFHKAMGDILVAYRKMGSLDAPMKAPVDEKGEAVADKTLILVFNDAEYKKKEQEYLEERKNVVEGQFRETTENSTAVLLTEPQNDGKIGE